MQSRQYIYSTVFSILMILFYSITGIPKAAAVSQESNDEGRQFLSGYIQTAFNNNNGFPSNEANAVLQTSDGYMWFATYSGLVRYDGTKFTTFSALKDDGFNSSNVRTLYEGSDGALWIGTNDKGLIRYEKGTFTYFDKDAGAPSNIVRAITENDDGIIYCGTAEGMFTIDTTSGDPDKYEISILPIKTNIVPFVISLCRDNKGIIYAVFNDGGLYAITPEGECIRLQSDERFYSVCVADGDIIVVGTQDTSVVLAKFDGNNFTVTDNIISGVKNIYKIYQDSSGRIWICAETGLGFFENINSKKFVSLTDIKYNGLFNGIYEDYENGFWITSSANGVLKLTQSTFTDENMLYGISPAAVNAIIKHNDFTYIGTDTGLMLFDSKRKPISNNITEKMTGSRIRDVYVDSKGVIWFCTYAGNGVVSYDPKNGEIKSILPDDGLNSEKTRRLLELSNGDYVLATGNGVNFIRDGKVISAKESVNADENQLPANMVLSFYESKDGTLFIGTDGNGLYTVKNGEVKVYNEDNGLTGSVILRIVGDTQSNVIWVSTGSGLCSFEKTDENTNDSNGGYNVKQVAKLPAYAIFDMIVNGGDLWMLTTDAILKTDILELLDENIPLKLTEIGRSSGLTSSLNANSRKYIDENNRLYICCDSGINSISLEYDLLSITPNATVNEVDVDGKTYQDYENIIVIPNHIQRLTFDISLLSYGLYDDTSIHYMLEGQDREETIVKTNGSEGFTDEVSYTNLKGGTYTFKLYSTGYDGNIGNTVIVKIVKEYGIFEYIYTQIIIVISAVILITFLSFFIAKYINKASLKKQNEYRSIIMQAITAIANAIDANDTYTKGHSVRVASYSAKIARRMGYNDDFIENIYYVGLLHDVGKIGIPTSILKKPDKLTGEEYEIMKTHPMVGRDILKDITTINNIALGAAEHHERWDGKGYYRGLSKEDISVEGRIISAADSYDAMSSDRAYRKALPKDVILEEFKRGKGSQFDPEVTGVVIKMIEQDAFSVTDINNKY